jgi:hypothetical protein
MRRAGVAFAVLCPILVGGCGISQVLRDEQTISIAKEAGELQHKSDLGALYAWPPHATAMVIDGEGNRCVRVASGARVTGGASEGAIKLEDVQRFLERLKGGRPHRYNKRCC